MIRRVETVAPRRMRLTTGPSPTPGPGEAVIRVETVGLCGSDYHLYDGTHPYARFPQVQGHEVVGVVEAYGPDTGGPPVHTRVAVEPLVACGRCFACRRDRYNCCRELQVLGAHLPGGLAERMVAPAARLHPVGDLPPEVAVLVEPVSIGLHAVNRGEVAGGDTVVVLGAGPIGQAVALAAADRGARVLVADRIASRLALAAAVGARQTADTTVDDLAARVEEFTGGDGAAVVVDATGAPVLIRAAVDLVAPSGTVVIAGISQDDVSIPVADFSRKEITVAGSRNNAGVFPAAVDLVRRHRERVAGLVTHTFALDETPAAIDHAIAHPEEVEKAVIRVATTP
jgi:2-desacetyl-2-hydroxyethyl bacteriochlorophyllide A dehydrogenase